MYEFLLQLPKNHYKSTVLYEMGRKSNKRTPYELISNEIFLNENNISTDKTNARMADFFFLLFQYTDRERQTNIKMYVFT